MPDLDIVIAVVFDYPLYVFYVEGWSSVLCLSAHFSNPCGRMKRKQSFSLTMKVFVPMRII